MFYRKTSPCHGNPCRILQKKINDKISKILVGFLVFRMEIVAWLSVNTAKTQNVFLFFQNGKDSEPHGKQKSGEVTSC